MKPYFLSLLCLVCVGCPLNANERSLADNFDRALHAAVTVAYDWGRRDGTAKHPIFKNGEDFYEHYFKN